MDKLRNAEQASDNRKLKSRLFRTAIETIFYDPKVEPTVLHELALQGTTTEDGLPLTMRSRSIKKDELVTKLGEPPFGITAMEISYFPARHLKDKHMNEKIILEAHGGDAIDEYTMQVRNPGLTEEVEVGYARVDAHVGERRVEATKQDLSNLQDILRAVRIVNF
jgi:hypothetical protein